MRKLALFLAILSPWLMNWVGVGMNLLVVTANRGQMPCWVMPGMTIPIEDAGHTLMTAHTHLKFLGDWIQVYFVDIGAAASPGDAFIFLGSYLQEQFPFLLASGMIGALFIQHKRGTLS